MKDKKYYLEVKDLYDRALLLVSDLFENKTDKEGLPYINHLIRVSVKLDSKKLKIAGLLHDTLEDTNLTKKDLLDLGFSKRIIEIVDSVTNKEGEIYNNKIKRIVDSKDIDVIKLKYADMSDNYNKDRLKLLSKDIQEKLTNKYGNNIKLLRSAIDNEKN